MSIHCNRQYSQIRRFHTMRICIVKINSDRRMRKKIAKQHFGLLAFPSFAYFINEIINSFFSAFVCREISIYILCFANLLHLKRYLSLHIPRWHHTQRSVIYELIVTCSRMVMMKRSLWWCRRLQIYSTETTQNATTTKCVQYSTDWI